MPTNLGPTATFQLNLFINDSPKQTEKIEGKADCDSLGVILLFLFLSLTAVVVVVDVVVVVVLVVVVDVVVDVVVVVFVVVFVVVVVIADKERLLSIQYNLL